jgi:hypothetical protein
VILQSTTTLEVFKSNLLYLLGIPSDDCCMRALVVSTGLHQGSFFFTSTSGARLTATDIANQLIEQVDGNPTYVLLQLGASQLLMPATKAPTGGVAPWMWGVAAGALGVIIVFYFVARTVKARRRAQRLVADNEVQFVSMNSVV